MRKFNYIWILSLLILYPLFLTSCDSDDISQNGESRAYAKDFSKGPVSLEMEVDQTEINTSGQLTIILRAKAGDEWKPSFPEPGDLGEFKVLSVKDTIPRLEEDGSIGIIRTIELKPFLSGDYEIPSLTLDYTKGENSGVLLTTPVQIKVTTLLPENTENLEIKELKEPDTFNYNRLIFYSALSFIILLIGFLIFLFFRKRKRDIVIPGIAPSEDAYNKLASLISMNLPEEGKYKEFYYRLNLIVRVYIEKQF
ncbi:MAG: hypothetical protein KAH95_15450, partial [Spirochaetales bacterium]|nr:hypothetical protein [Spirochaetales bacterium]